MGIKKNIGIIFTIFIIFVFLFTDMSTIYDRDIEHTIQEKELTEIKKTIPDKPSTLGRLGGAPLTITHTNIDRNTGKTREISKKTVFN